MITKAQIIEKELAKNEGATTQQVADICGVHNTYVSQIKRRLGYKVRSKGRATPEYIARVRAEQIATSMAGELSLNWLQKSW